jgi:hypothetical protein
MFSKVHIIQKGREYRKSAPFEWLCTLFKRKSGKSAWLRQFPEENCSWSLMKMPRFVSFGKVFTHHFSY